MKKNILISFFILLSIISFNPSFADNEEEAAMLYNEAIDLYKQDDINRSIELFKQAIELKQDFYEAHYNLAQILMSINKNDEAYKSLLEIIKLKPNDPEALYNIGKIQYKRGYLSSAHSYLIKITNSAPQFESAKLLIDKIEKRQKELELENKIKQNKTTYDAQGLALGVELGDFEAPSGIALDSRGNIFIASFLDNTIHKISIYGQKSVFSNSVLIRGPIGLAIDKNDNIYVANYSANTIVKITSEGNASIFSKVQKPYCLNYDNQNNKLFVTEQETNKLIKFDL